MELEKQVSAPAIIDSFERIEEKHILDQNQLKPLLGLLDHNLEPSFPGEKTQYNKITSVYFESPELKFLKDHLGGERDRFKLRIRTYTGRVRCLELKHKFFGVSKKRRIVIDDKSYQGLLKGRLLMWSTGLRNLNAQMSREKLRKRMTEMNNLISAYKLRPLVQVSYQRYAFEKDGLRVTVDSKLKYEYLKANESRLEDSLFEKAVDIRKKFSNGKHVIVEIKHKQNVPIWLRAFLTNRQSPPTDFSKFCWSLYEQVTGATPLVRQETQ